VRQKGRGVRARPGWPSAPHRFPQRIRFVWALLCGRAGRVTAKNGGSRAGQYLESLGPRPVNGVVKSALSAADYEGTVTDADGLPRALPAYKGPAVSYGKGFAYHAAVLDDQHQDERLRKRAFVTVRALAFGRGRSRALGVSQTEPPLHRGFVWACGAPSGPNTVARGVGRTTATSSRGGTPRYAHNPYFTVLHYEKYGL
jgi:hypothetical protein